MSHQARVLHSGKPNIICPVMSFIDQALWGSLVVRKKLGYCVRSAGEHELRHAIEYVFLRLCVAVRGSDSITKPDTTGPACVRNDLE